MQALLPGGQAGGSVYQARRDDELPTDAGGVYGGILTGTGESQSPGLFDFAAVGSQARSGTEPRVPWIPFIYVGGCDTSGLPSCSAPVSALAVVMAGGVHRARQGRGRWGRAEAGAKKAVRGGPRTAVDAAKPG